MQGEMELSKHCRHTKPAGRSSRQVEKDTQGGLNLVPIWLLMECLIVDLLRLYLQGLVAMVLMNSLILDLPPGASILGDLLSF